MTISARDRALLAVVAAIAAIGAFYVFALKPQVDRAHQLGHSVAAAQKTLTAAQDQYETGRAAERRLSATNTDYTAAQRAVPGQSNIPALLRLLQRTADAAHVSIQSISLSGSSSTSSSTSSPAAAPTPAPATTTGTSPGATSAQTAQTVPVSLTFGGGYQALNRMVQRLDGLVAVAHGHLRANGPLVGISSVSLSPSASGAGGPTHQLNIVLSATIYQYADTSSVLGSSSGGSS